MNYTSGMKYRQDSCVDCHNTTSGDCGQHGIYVVSRSADAALREELAALQEWKQIVLGTGTDQEAVIRMAAAEYTKTAVQCWKDENAKLREELAQAQEMLADTQSALNEHMDTYNQTVNELIDARAKIAALEGRS